MNRKLREQIFLMEMDMLKHVFGRTKLLNGSRHENDAGQAWHLAMMALGLHECPNEPVELWKVATMVPIHDLAEMDAGGALLLGEANAVAKEEAETKAAARVFGLLPEDQRREFTGLWKEFERKETPEARFAAPSIDSSRSSRTRILKDTHGLNAGSRRIRWPIRIGLPSLEVRKHSGAMPRS